LRDPRVSFWPDERGIDHESSCYLALTLTTASATTWHIKPDGTGDAPTIQGGVTMAADGDTVLLAPGTYTGAGNRDIDVPKSITITSENGPEATIIDCQGLRRGFYFSDWNSYPVLSGVTIQNGSGGGISLIANATISNNIFRENSTAGWGGAIICSADQATIADNTFIGNSAGRGGGIAIDYTNSVHIMNNVFSDNNATSQGGAIYGHTSGVAIINCTLSENGALSGGGIYWGAGEGTLNITNTIVAFSSQGGAMVCEGPGVGVRLCDLYGNAGGDALCGNSQGDNFSSDPLFCGVLGSGNYFLRSNSLCAPQNRVDGELIGALLVGCGALPVKQQTWGAIKARFRSE
jgi:predicted outer membrane repeat protein